MGNGEEQIYDDPDSYDLEHSKAETDVAFFCSLARHRKPARILELACGNGRITLPLAAQAEGWGGKVVGLDSNAEMLENGRKKSSAHNLTWIQGDLREWHEENGFDLVICPCSSMSHLLDLKDHLRAWKTAFNNTQPNGAFVVAEQMANIPVLAESSIVPPRVLLEIDNDTQRQNPPGESERLVRYRATRYFADQQRAVVRFLYDKMGRESAVTERFLSDYESHVFFPRELELLYTWAGFTIQKVWGDYQGGPFRERSRVMIISGLRPQ